MVCSAPEGSFRFPSLTFLAFTLTSPSWRRCTVLYRLFSSSVLFPFLEMQPLAHSRISRVSPVHLHLPRKQTSKISGSGVPVSSAIHTAELAHSSLGRQLCIPPSQVKVSGKVCSSSATSLRCSPLSFPIPYPQLSYRLPIFLCLTQADIQILTVRVMKINIIHLLCLSCFLSNTNLCLSFLSGSF